MAELAVLQIVGVRARGGDRVGAAAERGDRGDRAEDGSRSASPMPPPAAPGLARSSCTTRTSRERAKFWNSSSRSSSARPRRAAPSWPRAPTSARWTSRSSPTPSSSARASAACSWSRSPWTAKYSTAGESPRETVVLEQAAELRLRDRGLACLDRVQDRGGAELVVGRRPRGRAAARLGSGSAGSVPSAEAKSSQSAMCCASSSACIRAGGPRAPAPRRRAGTRRRSGPAPRASARLLPARVERMLEHVPALPSRVDACNHSIWAPPVDRPRELILSLQADESRAR